MDAFLYSVFVITKHNTNNVFLNVCSFNSKIVHYHVKFKDNMYTIDNEEKFDNLTQMVEHYQKDADGLVTRLRVPVVKEGKQHYSVEMDDFKKCE